MARKVVRTDPDLWEKIVEKFKRTSKHGGVGWNARKAQMAVKEYKDLGGGYVGDKDSNNSLVKWTREDWGYVGEKGKSRYLPKKVREKLSSGEKAATSRQKNLATSKGKKYASYSEKVSKLVRKSNG